MIKQVEDPEEPELKKAKRSFPETQDKHEAEDVAPETEEAPEDVIDFIFIELINFGC